MYGYLIGDLIFLVIWLVLFFLRKDLRKEMFVMSVLVGCLSVVTGYFWWTKDWWQPLTITGTRVGIEDFLAGFAGGGIIASIYEEVFRKRLYRRTTQEHYPGGFTILLLLGWMTSLLFEGAHFTSFWASTFAMILVATVIFYYRRDLFWAGLMTGICMVIISFVIYRGILLVYPAWVQHTYLLKSLSGIIVFGIPIEELAFWFLAGCMWGPFYEYWQGEKLRKISKLKS